LYWSVFGQAVLLFLIQIGGLGFMTIATFFFFTVNKRMKLSQRETMVESINLSRVYGIMQFSRDILLGTLLFEGLGTALLAIRFVPRFGPAKGLWISLFHAVSAFCNAGFDILGGKGSEGSFVPFHDDWLVNTVLIFLIVIGGLGYIVWADLRVNRFSFRKFQFHTKVVLMTSVVLLFGGAVFLFFAETNFTGRGDPLGTRIIEALFASTTARTAGFNTVNVGSMSGAAKLITIFLMFVGGSPGSTAGGIKTTTLAVLILASLSAIRGNKRPSAFGRSIPETAVKKATSIYFINLLCALAVATGICALQNLSVLDVLFESFSAIGTVGMSTGITGELSTVSAYLIALLMFLGRVGSVSFSVALLEKRKKPPVAFPDAEITVG
ncbi:MAG: Trk family potassium uptake protein, partial [Clostridia bacterium]|nr:Trk family potassium uptake protein [Clostridia bacterium]